MTNTIRNPIEWSGATLASAAHAAEAVGRSVDHMRQTAHSPAPAIRKISSADVWQSLREGFADFDVRFRLELEMARLAMGIEHDVVRGIFAGRNIVIRRLGNLQEKLIARGLGQSHDIREDGRGQHVQVPRSAHRARLHLVEQQGSRVRGDERADVDRHPPDDSCGWARSPEPATLR